MPAAAPSAAAPAEAAVDDPAKPTPLPQGFPASLDPAGVDYLVSLGIRRAEKCHPHGHAVGTAELTLTFGENGRVNDARLVGEPLESAPVARCILDQGRAVVIPRFSGEPFSIKRNVTLR